MMRCSSLKRTLFIHISLLILLTLLAVSVLAYRSVHTEIAEEYDAQLVTDCNVLWLLTREDMQESSTPKFENVDVSSLMYMQPGVYKPPLELYGSWHTFRVWKDGKILIRSDNAEAENLPIEPEGLSTQIIKGEEWRIYSLHVKGSNAVVEAFENFNSRKRIENEILQGLLFPLLLLIPLVGLMLRYGINSGLHGLQHFANQVEKRSADDLTELESQSAPNELKPLMLAINGLLAKLRGAIQRERELIDNTAHALFTPLSALKVQAELLSESSNAQERSHAIHDIKAGVNRATKLIQQLLFLSRLNHQAVSLEPVNLYNKAQKVLAEISALAFEKQIELSLEGDENTQIIAEKELLVTLIRSIVENAIKYTPEGGAVEVRVLYRKSAIVLEIEDNGAGITESEREKVFERFYRGQTSIAQGSGLGLAIAKSIADVFHATIILSTPLKGSGLCVQISFTPA